VTHTGRAWDKRVSQLAAVICSFSQPRAPHEVCPRRTGSACRSASTAAVSAVVVDVLTPVTDEPFQLQLPVEERDLLGDASVLHGAEVQSMSHDVLLGAAVVAPVSELLHQRLTHLAVELAQHHACLLDQSVMRGAVDVSRVLGRAIQTSNHVCLLGAH
jgi:hypothetical protein